ncbi:MAG: YggT family protein [Ruminococcaceae bacterium]|nr:YggT family protein [Oscillospiraceae bacterium]
MVEALYVVSTIVRIFLMVLQLAMLLRAILSWFPMDSNKFLEFLYGVTEPFVYPFRALFNKLNWFQNIPIDISFTVAYLAIFLLGIFLP